VATERKLIVNLTRGTAVCEGVLADRLLPRMRGLLGRASLAAGEGLLIRPAPSIHTAFMRFPIDALFLDGDLTVLGIEAEMRPWRVASRRRARAVLELAAGESGRLGVCVGDRLSVREHDAAVARVADRSVAHAHGSRAAVAMLDRPDQGEGDAEDGAEGGTSLVEPASVRDGEAITASTPDDAAWLGRGVTRMRPLSVLVISEDRRFRSVTSVLIARRGCVVTTTEHGNRLEELAGRIAADVVVIDVEGPRAAARARARVRALPGSVGAVIVEEDPVSGPDGPQALAKWGPFERLYAAIETADGDRSFNGGHDGRA